MKKLLVLSGFITALIFVQVAHATKPEFTTWCHVTPSGNQETLHLPEQALSGHVDAQGNILHAGDHAGECIGITPTIEVSPTIEITPTIVVSPTASPSAIPTPTGDITEGSKEGDHRSDGLCSKPPCVDNQSGQPISKPTAWK
jgi:hypothetical protein